METTLPTTGNKVDALGRRIVSAEERQRLLEQYHQSGQSAAAFAKARGIRSTTFGGWLERQRSVGERRKGPKPALQALDTAPLFEAKTSEGSLIEVVVGAVVIKIHRP